MSSSVTIFKLEMIAITALRQLRKFSTTPKRLGEIFVVQDIKDYQDRVVKNKEAVIVEFQAEWCPSCHLLRPKLESRIAKEKNIHFAKVDTDKFDELAAEFKITMIPHVVAYVNGKVVDKFTGNKDEDILDEFVSKLSEKVANSDK